MRFWRAVGSGILLWVLIFIEISITMIGFGLQSLWVWTIHYILLIPFVLWIARMYYNRGDRVNGFILGIVIVVVGAILDIIITVPMFSGGNYGMYFSQGTLWVGFFEAIVIAGVYDALRRKK